MKNNLSGIYESITVSDFKKGDAYNIIEGPLKGQVGKVVNLFKNKIKLELPSLGMLVTLKTV